MDTKTRKWPVIRAVAFSPLNPEVPSGLGETPIREAGYVGQTGLGLVGVSLVPEAGGRPPA